MNTNEAEPTSPAFRIRQATADDAFRLARLRWEFRATTYGGPDEAEDAFVARATAWMRARLAAGAADGRTANTWHAWVAEREGESDLAGQIWLQLIEKLPNPTDEPEWHAYISNVYVRPSARGGLGSRLLQTSLAWLDSLERQGRGVHDILLWSSPRSRSLYERHGFLMRDDVLVRRIRAR